MSAKTASIPFLSMMRRPFVDTFRRTQRFSLSTQKRRVCKLGKNRRRVLLFACDTLLPVIGRLPVTWHTRAMVIPLDNDFFGKVSLGQPPCAPLTRLLYFVVSLAF